MAEESLRLWGQGVWVRDKGHQQGWGSGVKGTGQAGESPVLSGLWVRIEGHGLAVCPGASFPHVTGRAWLADKPQRPAGRTVEAGAGAKQRLHGSFLPLDLLRLLPDPGPSQGMKTTRAFLSGACAKEQPNTLHTLHSRGLARGPSPSPRPIFCQLGQADTCSAHSQSVPS